jgi:hypothetical protein
MWRTYYRIRFDNGEEEPDTYLGQALVSDVDVLRDVPEPEAICFDTAREAAEAALRFGVVPFVVEVAG